MSGAMKLLFAVAVAVAVAQVAYAKVPRGAASTAAPAGEQVQLEDVLSRAKASLTNISSEVSELLGLQLPQTQDEVLQVLNTQSDNLKTKIQEFIGAIDKEVTKARADPSVNSVLTSISERLNETANTFQDAAPGVTKSAAEIKAQIESGLSVVLEEAGKLAKTVGGEASSVQESLDSLTRSAVEEAVNFGKQVEDKLKTAIGETQATHA